MEARDSRDPEGQGGYRSVSNVSLCYSKLETLVPLPLSHAKMI